MDELSPFFHYGVIGLTVSINALSTAIGQGLINKAAIDAVNVQPQSRDAIAKIALICSALVETGVLLALFVATIIINNTVTLDVSLWSHVAKLGAFFAITIPGLFVGIASSYPVKAACLSTARQPFFADQIFRLILMILSIIQTPLILGFIAAIFIASQAPLVYDWHNAMRLIASGFAFGAGSIGPLIGLVVYGYHACKGAGMNRAAYSRLLTFSLISLAIIETPVLFCLATAFTMIFTTIPETFMIKGITYLCAAFVITLGTLGAGSMLGNTAATAARQIAINPDNYPLMIRTSILGQAIIDTAILYAVLAAFVLIFFG